MARGKKADKALTPKPLQKQEAGRKTRARKPTANEDLASRLRRGKQSRDRLTKARRSWNMSRIKGKNTGPEMVVRSLLHRMGYRFRLHVKDLPGKPDVVLPKYKTVIFVHGCFWHRHKGCRNCTTPTNRREWWLQKLEGNAARDKKHARALRKLGWRVLVVWECETEEGPFLNNQFRKRMTKMINATLPEM